MTNMYHSEVLLLLLILLQNVMYNIKFCSICQHFSHFVNYSGLISHLQFYKLVETFPFISHGLETT